MEVVGMRSTHCYKYAHSASIVSCSNQRMRRMHHFTFQWRGAAKATWTVTALVRMEECIVTVADGGGNLVNLPSAVTNEHLQLFGYGNHWSCLMGMVCTSIYETHTQGMQDEVSSMQISGAHGFNDPVSQMSVPYHRLPVHLATWQKQCWCQSLSVHENWVWICFKWADTHRYGVPTLLDSNLWRTGTF